MNDNSVSLLLKCCKENIPTRKITYDSGYHSTYVMLVCEDHYKLPSYQLFIITQEKLQ